MRVEFLGTLGVRILFYILPSLSSLAFDSATPNLAVNIKEHGETALPMGEDQGGKKGRWWKIALVSIGNVLLGVGLQMGIELLITQVLHLRSLLKISIVVPMPWSILKDLFFGLLLREVLTYVLHRYALHSPTTPRLTEMHSSWQHSVIAPFSLVAHYDHPIVYLIHVFLPMYIPAVLLRFHLLTFHIYLILVSLEETFTYSGYSVLPSAFILGGMARRQDKHLMCGGDGNYGCFGLVDFCMGTNLGTDLVDDVIEEAEEKQVAGRAKRKMRRVGKKPRTTRNLSEYQDEDEDFSENEEEERPKRRGKGKRNSNDNGDAEGKSKNSQRKASSAGRTGRKKSDADAAEEDLAVEEVEKPKRKPRKLERKGSGKLQG